jgi:hypothetical protein
MEKFCTFTDIFKSPVSILRNCEEIFLKPEILVFFAKKKFSFSLQKFFSKYEEEVIFCLKPNLNCNFGEFLDEMSLEMDY